MPERAWEDEFTLLCERCGYVIEGLEPSGNCPECGKAIAESLPERRVGTAWQRKPSVLSFYDLAMATLLHPLGTLDAMRFSRTSGQLGATYAAIAAVGVAAGAFVASVNSFARPFDRVGVVGLVVAGVVAIVSWAISVVALMFLTWVETRGLVFFAARRGGRVTPEVARAITAHGSVGWVIAGIGAAVALFPMSRVEAAGHGTALDASVWAIGVLLVIAGFLFFETFAWLGLRRLKYANRARPSTTMEA
ncbi:MAG: hypothetical protein R3B57_11995 [Phycisphaerales bacterium]